jgi:AraC-like DNA-binding protein
MRKALDENEQVSRTVRYREFPPPGALRRHVRCLWHLRIEAAPGHIDTVYPDGCCELIAHRLAPMHACSEAGDWRQQECCIFAGQQRTAVRLAARAAADCVGVRLQPAASAMFPHISLPHLRDRIVELASLDADFAARFSKAASLPDIESAIAGVCRLLHETQLPVDDRIERAVADLEASDGTLSIASLIAASGMGERSFQNAFMAQVGLSAKEFSRVRRLHATIRQLEAGDRPIADLAIASGFADQAHATREVRRVTGTTPARLRAALQRDRDGDFSVQLAAAFVRGRSV